MSIRGFTLIELVIVAAIISIVSAVTLTKNGSFNDKMILTQKAYSVASTIRKAQSLGYGFYISNTLPGDSYVIFQDVYPTNVSCFDASITTPGATPGNCRYDASNSDEFIKTITIGDATITKFCVTGGTICSDSGWITGGLNILFSRRDSQVRIEAYTFLSGWSARPAATLYLADTKGNTSCVTISSGGQVTVPQLCP